MPPKRQAPASPSRKKARTQPSIASFFTSPSQPAAKRTKAASSSVICVSDSDSEDDIVVLTAPVKPRTPPDSGRVADAPGMQIERDAALALRLAREWDAEGGGVGTVTANGSGDGGGSKASTKEQRNVKPEPAPTPSPSKLHPMFAKRSPQPPVPPVTKRNSTGIDTTLANAEAGPSRPRQVAAAHAEPAPAIDFDTDALLFRPREVDVAAWPGGRLPYSVLVGVYVQVAATRSRLTIVRVLTNFLHLLLTVSPSDLTPSLYLLSNTLRPSYEPCELSVGAMVLGRAIREVSGLQSRDLKALWAKYGDPGDVACAAKSRLRTLVTPAPLVVADVYRRIVGLADIRGQQSTKLKGDVVRRLMVQARGEEVRYLVRTLVGNLRIGAVRLTLLTALGRAAALGSLPPETLDAVLPLPVTKGKKPPDPARDAAEAACTAAVRLVRRVFVRHPNYADLVVGVQDGLEDLATRVPLSVGIPISPMLGSITRSIDEVYTRLGRRPFTAETKLDGQRLQMHVRRGGPQSTHDGGRWVDTDSGRVWVRLFSRHLEDMTQKYPDVCALAPVLLASAPPSARPPFPTTVTPAPAALVALLDTQEITSIILDAEIVAVDRETGTHRTFQELTNRAKKDVQVADIKVVVEVCAFDLMLLNDEPLLAAPLAHRRHLLRTLLAPSSDPANPLRARFSHIASVDSVDLDGPADLRRFFDSVVEQKAEGLMVKLLDAPSGAQVAAGDGDRVIVVDGDGDSEDADEGNGTPEDGERVTTALATYEPDQRSQGWLKVKKDYLEGLGDSLDLVPIGAWWGLGRKAGWWSPILLAARNPESGALEAVCKCISGFTDAFYKDLLVRYPPEGKPDVCNPTAPLGYVETGGLVPDFWFAPSEVWEIRGADITLSPVYPAAATYIGGERGLSLRFPRFIRVRDDKGVDDATTADEFADMYRRQMARPPDRAPQVVPRVSDDEGGGGEGDEGDGGAIAGEDGGPGEGGEGE